MSDPVDAPNDSNVDNNLDVEDEPVVPDIPDIDEPLPAEPAPIIESSDELESAHSMNLRKTDQEYKDKRVYVGKKGGLYTLSRGNDGSFKKYSVPKAFKEQNDVNVSVDEDFVSADSLKELTSSLKKPVEPELEMEPEPEFDDDTASIIGHAITDAGIVLNDWFVDMKILMKKTTTLMIERREALAEKWAKYLEKSGWLTAETKVPDELDLLMAYGMIYYEGSKVEEKDE